LVSQRSMRLGAARHVGAARSDTFVKWEAVGRVTREHGSTEAWEHGTRCLVGRERGRGTFGVGSRLFVGQLEALGRNQ
jgi:hypothetical protein